MGIKVFFFRLLLHTQRIHWTESIIDKKKYMYVSVKDSSRIKQAEREWA